MKKVVVTGSFDNLRAPDVRLLEEAARLGDLHVFLWSDQLVHALDGASPKFPVAERKYLLEGIRYVSGVEIIEQLPDRNALPPLAEGDWAARVVSQADDNDQKRLFCASAALPYHPVQQADLNNYPPESVNIPEKLPGHKKVIVTGCYDWFHSGHLRFFEEASELGELYVVVGSDRNVRLLKGAGHPMLSQDERRYLVQSVRFVKQALISSGSGWMDAEPEIARIRPDMYVVNEDGDQPEKRSFCEENGIRYVVLKRTPKEGLPKRQSTVLRGF